VTALFRRADVTGQAAGADDVLERGALRLDTQRFEVFWRGQPVDLTVTEFWILHSLARFPGHVKNRETLMREANMLVDDHTVTSYLKRLRRKFEGIDPAFDAIETVYGLGYRFVERG
jgi:two-component system OmpR family response regulator